MSNIVRISLLIGAILSFWFMLRNIRKSNLVISESIFWIFFGIALVILALFPELVFSITRALGIMSSTNLVFLVIIALLIFRIFQMELKLSALNTKFRSLVQDLAIKEYEETKEDKSL